MDDVLGGLGDADIDMSYLRGRVKEVGEKGLRREREEMPSMDELAEKYLVMILWIRDSRKDEAPGGT
jgi:hypothetical protein